MRYFRGYIELVFCYGTCHLICFVLGNNCHFNDLKLNLKLKVRYYATFKVRKLESLFYKISRFLKKKLPLALGIADRANIICKYTIYIFFQFWAWLLQFLFCVISKTSSFFWLKKKLNNFCCIALLVGWAQKEYLRFLKSYFKLEILIFFRGVFYSRYVQLNKSSFSEGKNISGDI